MVFLSGNTFEARLIRAAPGPVKQKGLSCLHFVDAVL
jgi:hypothetical protein